MGYWGAGPVSSAHLGSSLPAGAVTAICHRCPPLPWAPEKPVLGGGNGQSWEMHIDTGSASATSSIQVWRRGRHDLTPDLGGGGAVGFPAPTFPSRGGQKSPAVGLTQGELTLGHLGQVPSSLRPQFPRACQVGLPVFSGVCEEHAQPDAGF